MRIFIALLLGAFGLVLLVAGGTGSAQGLWTAIFTRAAGGNGQGFDPTADPGADPTTEAGNAGAGAGAAAKKILKKKPKQSKAGAGVDSGGK